MNELDELDKELDTIVGARPPTRSGKAAMTDARRDQIVAALKESGDAVQLIHRMVDAGAQDGDHMVLLRMPCVTEGHGDVEVYGAHSGITDLLELFSGGLSELTNGMTGRIRMITIGAPPHDDSTDTGSPPTPQQEGD